MGSQKQIEAQNCPEEDRGRCMRGVGGRASSDVSSLPEAPIEEGSATRVRTSLGRFGTNAVCVSFSEPGMRYFFKKRWL